jgi:two-component system, repressor protein LuxO
MIARAFLKSFAKEERKAFRSIAPDAEALLAAYPWPGNVRQLQNAIRNAVVLHDGAALERAMLPPQLLRAAPRIGAATPVATPAPAQFIPPMPVPDRARAPPAAGAHDAEAVMEVAPPPSARFPADSRPSWRQRSPPSLTMKEIERRSHPRRPPPHPARRPARG